MNWIGQNVATVLVLAAVLALVGLSVWFSLRERKKHPHCGGGCAGCPLQGGCRAQKKKEVI